MFPYCQNYGLFRPLKPALSATIITIERLGLEGALDWVKQNAHFLWYWGTKGERIYHWRIDLSVK